MNYFAVQSPRNHSSNRTAKLLAKKKDGKKVSPSFFLNCLKLKLPLRLLSLHKIALPRTNFVILRIVQTDFQIHVTINGKIGF